MKKCPMMKRKEKRKVNGEYHKLEYREELRDCIGDKCAAYVERPRVEHSLLGHPKQWSCAMMPREVWHDVEDSNA